MIKFTIYQGALIAAGMGLSLVYLLRFCMASDSALKSGVKTGAIALPAVGLTLAGAPIIPLTALWACALGDFLLSRPGARALQFGIVAFALGHVLYILGFAVHFAPQFDGGLIGIGGPAILLMLGLSTEVWLRPHTGTLKWPVRVYVMLILMMGCVAAQQPIPQTTIFWGALAFILSDLVLSVQIFVQIRGAMARLAPFVIWFFYYAAQVLIFYGFIA